LKAVISSTLKDDLVPNLTNFFFDVELSGVMLEIVDLDTFVFLSKLRDLQINQVPVTGLRLRSARKWFRVERSRNPIHGSVILPHGPKWLAENKR
jgi:hypothetical protein